MIYPRMSSTATASCMSTFLEFNGPRWIFTIAVAAAAFAVGHFGTPYCKAFAWDDESINMPSVAQETFANWTLALIVAVPILLQALVILALPPHSSQLAQPPSLPSSSSPANVPMMAAMTQRRRLLLEINTWTLVQLQSLMLQVMFVETMKLYAGRLRPDFLDRLRATGLTPATGLHYHCELMSNAVVREGRLSFPSGHASTSFAAMVPLTVFLMHYLRPWFYGCIVRLVVCILPLGFAFVVAISRTRDNLHHFSDILAGSLIGVFAAIGACLVNVQYSSANGDYTPIKLTTDQLQRAQRLTSRLAQQQQQHRPLRDDISSSSAVGSVIPLIPSSISTQPLHRSPTSFSRSESYL